MSIPPEPSLDVPVGLCLGGVDPSGGAGLLRDSLTLAALGVHPMGVSTGETVQNGVGCLRIEKPALCPLERLDSLAMHLRGNWGAKLGMWVLEAPLLQEVGRRLTRLGPACRLWDPILRPSQGVGMHESAELAALAEALLSTGDWVVAPNRVEAAALAGCGVGADPRRLAGPFLERGAEAVWLKGGHGEGEQVEDFWITRRAMLSLGAFQRLPGERRGTGCAVGSAWLAFRLQGLGGPEAATRASAWLRSRWERAFAPGWTGRPLFAPQGARLEGLLQRGGPLQGAEPQKGRP